MNSQATQVFTLKPTMILTTLLFLLVAPAPNSQDIAEITANFLIANNHSGLMASEKPLQFVQEEILK